MDIEVRFVRAGRKYPNYGNAGAFKKKFKDIESLVKFFHESNSKSGDMRVYFLSSKLDLSKEQRRVFFIKYNSLHCFK